MSFEQREKARAAAWKAYTSTLPVTARTDAPYVNKDGVDGPSPYPFCIPRKFAHHNLLPEVRTQALALFEELGIAWHAEVNGGPTNHLVSSQVQCVNALGQMVSDPSRLVAALGDVLNIGEVLEIEPGRFLTFEYIGPEDFFNEAPRDLRTRGSRCTSVDAAFLHRALDGVTELVLAEWKYTEAYGVRAKEPKKDATRRRRYLAALESDEGPVRSDVLSFEDLLDEPFYQLMRQQLLAHALETSHAEGAERVRVVHVAPHGNEAYQKSLARTSHRELGATVAEVWARLLRRTDRFLSVDSDLFLDPAITSPEYALRYDPLVVYDEAGLLAAFEVDDVYGFEDAIQFDGDVVFYAECVDLVVDGIGISLQYPFHLRDLHALSAELDPG